MKFKIELSDEELFQLLQLTRLDDPAEAVVWAVREAVRLNQLRELKNVSGKVDFDEDWQHLEKVELAENDFPL